MRTTRATSRYDRSHTPALPSSGPGFSWYLWFAQYTVPAVLSSLIECRRALDVYMESCLKDDNAADIYIKDAVALAKGTRAMSSSGALPLRSISLTSWFGMRASDIDNGIYRVTDAFYHDLSSFNLPASVKSALPAYVSFSA